MIYTDEMITEILKCRDDLSHFATYLKGEWNLNLNTEEFAIKNNDTNSTLVYLLWYMTFHSNLVILCGFPKFIMAKEACAQLKLMYAESPDWLCPIIMEDSSRHIRFENGCMIHFEAMTECFGKGRSVSQVYLHNFEAVNPKVQAGVYRWWELDCYKKSTAS